MALDWRNCAAVMIELCPRQYAKTLSTLILRGERQPFGGPNLLITGEQGVQPLANLFAETCTRNWPRCRQRDLVGYRVLHAIDGSLVQHAGGGEFPAELDQPGGGGLSAKADVLQVVVLTRTFGGRHHFLLLSLCH
jgi:hypothetical protein